MTTTYTHPANGHREQVTGFAVLWSLLFGPFYFLARGVWTHALISAGLAFLTWGLSWLVYPWFAPAIMRGHFARNGWMMEDGR